MLIGLQVIELINLYQTGFRMVKLLILLCLVVNFHFEGVWALKVAVVSYNPVSDGIIIPELRLRKNVEQFKNLASQSLDYDIIVFPESTLYSGGWFKTALDIFAYSTIIPPLNSEVACDDEAHRYATFFKELSCMARNLKKYVAINLAENVPCKGSENCSTVGFEAFNTNVVFDDEGKVIAKYQKFNLFGEPYMTKPNKQLVTFEMKGLKIGLFTCFDIIFEEPALELVREKNIDVAIYPLMWYSELPFLTALQAEQQWAQETDVILLAAGGNKPFQGSGGSGIFKGKQGTVKSTFTVENVSKVLYHDLATLNTNKPESTEVIDKKAKEMDGFPLMKENLECFSTKLLDPKIRSFETQVCNGKGPNKICCDFNVHTNLTESVLSDSKNHYQYHLVAFSGVRTFSGVATGGIEACAVIACTSELLNSCAQRFDDYDSISWPLRFTKIEVSAKFLHDKHIQFPNSLLSNLAPLPVSASEWSTTKHEDGSVERKHILKTPQDRLLTFGIFGRDFNRDGHEVTKPEQKEKNNDKPKDDNGGAAFVKLQIGVTAASCLLVFINAWRL